jgi:uncharacterized protein YqeY
MRDEISDGYKTALKAGDKRRTATLRSIIAAIKDKDIALRGEGKGPASDAELVTMFQKMAKQREESLEIFTKAGRTDLADVEREELSIIGELLPKMMSDAEVDAAIAAAIAQTGAAGGKDMGKVIAALKAEYPGKIDFGKASGRVKAALG